MTEQEKSKSNERPVLHKDRFSSGTHHYFFEVKEANNGSKYLVIDQKRKRANGESESVKMRIFEDELLEFQRILQKVIRIALSEEQPVSSTPEKQSARSKNSDADLQPAFFNTLLSTHDWKEFEQYTYYALKLLGIQAAYKFLGERQAGRSDGFFKFGNLAVIYDCTLDARDLEEKKREQIINYCNRLKQGSIELSGEATEEFHTHHKQVWIVTRGKSHRIKVINDIVVKEVAIQDIMNVYQERLKNMMSDESLEIRLRNIG